MQAINGRTPILAPCGVFCGACPSFGESCRGCASESKNQSRKSKWDCKIRVCCYENKNQDYCIYCKEFPCLIFHKKLLAPHQGDPRFVYRHEIPEIFPRLNTFGLMTYLDFQRQRWTCKTCGGTIRFYTYLCDSCGKKQHVGQIN